MDKDNNKWSDIKDTAQDKFDGFREQLGGDSDDKQEDYGDSQMADGTALHDHLDDEENTALQEELAADTDPDPNRPRFGESLDDYNEDEVDSDSNYDTTRP